MLTITVPSMQFWDEKNNKFIYSKETVLNLEHSLIAISKWESKYHKPYLYTKEKTESESRYYVKCMTINKVSDDKVYWALTADNINEIDEYIHDPMSAVVFENKEKKSNKNNKDNKNKNNKRKGYMNTTEFIYYLMASYNIPHEYEKWHIERLLNLLRICREEAEKQNENSNQKKEDKRTTVQQLDRMAALNERNKAALHTRG